MTNPSDNDCLVVICLDRVELAVTSRCPEKTFVYDNTCYEDQGFGDFTGFYDWLRNYQGHIIGVRYLPADELTFLFRAVAHLPYVAVNWQTKAIALYFSQDRSIDESVSNDQDFGDNRVLKSAQGRFAISFNAGPVIGSLTADAATRISVVET